MRSLEHSWVAFPPREFCMGVPCKSVILQGGSVIVRRRRETRFVRGVCVLLLDTGRIKAGVSAGVALRAFARGKAVVLAVKPSIRMHEQNW